MEAKKYRFTSTSLLKAVPGELPKKKAKREKKVIALGV